jgi:hypothetical protein
MQAAEEGLTIQYESPNLAKVHYWAKTQWEQSKHRAVGVYAGALGYGYNTELLQKNGVAELKCWTDLTDPRFRDEVQVADPNSSGTAYTLLATVMQLMGEDKGFDYLKRLHRNVNQYTKSGAAPAKATSLGETLMASREPLFMPLNRPCWWDRERLGRLRRHLRLDTNPAALNKARALARVPPVAAAPPARRAGVGPISANSRGAGSRARAPRPAQVPE